MNFDHCFRERKKNEQYSKNYFKCKTIEYSRKDVYLTKQSAGKVDFEKDEVEVNVHGIFN